jgi:hypothetical protein
VGTLWQFRRLGYDVSCWRTRIYDLDAPPDMSVNALPDMTLDALPR